MQAELSVATSASTAHAATIEADAAAHTDALKQQQHKLETQLSSDRATFEQTLLLRDETLAREGQ